MRALLIVLGALCIWMVLKLSCNEAVEFKLTNTVCKSMNESWFVFHECRLKAVSRNKTTLSINATVLHPARVIHVQYQLFQKANGYKPWLIHGVLDVCQFLVKRYNPVAILIAKMVQEFTNFNHTCPYVGPQIVSGLYPRWKYLPHTLPTGDYLLALNWTFDRRLQFISNVYFTFTEDLK